MSDGTLQVIDPTTGEVKQLAANEAQAAFVQGKVRLPNGQAVPMVHADGTVADFPAEKAQAALDTGKWNFADHRQVATADAKNQPIRAFAESTLAGLSFGASDAIARASGADTDAMAARRETGAGTAGTVTSLGLGLLGPGLLGKLGAGAAKTALEAALAPTLALDTAAAGIEATAAKTLTNTISSTAARSAVAAGLGRAAEGAAYGMGGALSEEALGNERYNAEHLLAGAGMGAILGGAAGSAFGGIRGKLLDKAATGAMTEEAFAAGARASGIDVSDAGAKKWWPRLREAVGAGVQRAGELGGYRAEDVAAVNTPRARKLLMDLDGSLEAGSRDLRDALQGVADNQAASKQAVYGGMRTATLERVLPKGNGHAILSGVSDDLQALRGKYAGIVHDWADLGFRSPEAAESVVRPYVKQVDDLEASLSKHVVAPEENPHDYAYHATPAENLERIRAEGLAPSEGGKNFAFKKNRNRVYFSGEADAEMWAQKLADTTGGDVARLRGRVATEAVPGANEAVRIRTEPVHPKDLEVFQDGAWKPLLGAAVDRTPVVSDAAALDAFKGLDKLKSRLAAPAKFDEELGAAGARELANRFRDAHQLVRDGLEDTSRWGQAGEVQATINRAYAAREEAWSAVQKALRVDREGEFTAPGVLSYVRGMDRMRGDDMVEALKTWRAADQEWTAAVEKVIPSSGLRGPASAVHARLDKVLERLDEDVGVNSSLKALRARRNLAYGLENQGLVGGALIGGFAGGPLGAVVGAVGGKVLGGVYKAVFDPGRFALDAANMAAQTERFNGWLQGKAAQMSGAVGGLFPTLPAGRVAARSTLAMLEAKSESERYDAYEKRLAELSHLSDPATFQNRALLAMGTLPSTLPNTATAATMTAAAATQVLIQHIPAANPGTYGIGATGMHASPRPAARDVLRFAQVDRSVQDPASVLERAAEGRPVAKHEVDAIVQAYPQLVAGLRQRMLEELAKRDRAPTGQLRRNFEMILGQPLDARRLSGQQEVHAQAAAAKPQPVAQPRSARANGPGRTASDGQKLDTYPSLPQ